MRVLCPYSWAAEGRPEGAAVTVAIRPESLAIHCAQPGPGSVAGVVQARQYLGGRQMLHVVIDGRAAPVAVAILGARNDAASSLLPGHPVWLSWKDDAAVVLDE